MQLLQRKEDDVTDKTLTCVDIHYFNGELRSEKVNLPEGFINGGKNMKVLIPPETK